MAKLAYQGGISSSCVIAATTAARALAFIIFCNFRNLSFMPQKGEWQDTISGGFYQALSVTCLIAALKYLPGPVVITIYFSYTIVLLFFLAWKKEVELTRTAIATTLLASVGISFVVDVWSSTNSLNTFGLILAIGAALSRLGRIYNFGQQVKVLDPMVVGGRAFGTAFLFILPLFYFDPLKFTADSTAVTGLAVCCLSLAIGSFGTFYSLKFLGSFQYSLTVKLEPIFTSLFSLYFVNDILTSTQYFGIFLVVTCLIWYQLYEARRKVVLN